MSYVAQLLPDAEQARLLRGLLMNAVNVEWEHYSESELDALTEMLVKLSSDIRKNSRRAN